MRANTAKRVSHSAREGVMQHDSSFGVLNAVKVGEVVFQFLKYLRAMLYVRLAELLSRSARIKGRTAIRDMPGCAMQQVSWLCWSDEVPAAISEDRPFGQCSCSESCLFVDSMPWAYAL